MHCIKNGPEIFKSLARKFNNQKLTDLAAIRIFFSELLDQTEGWVIVDFLDAGNWDKIETFELSDDRLLTLIWHDYRSVDESENEIYRTRSQLFPASLYSLEIFINTIVPIVNDNLAIFLLSGYSKTQKEIDKIYKKKSLEYGVFNERFFEKVIVRKIKKYWEVIDFHCTPIYSIAIIPKSSGLSSFDSKKILYLYNIENLRQRITQVYEGFDKIKNTNTDLICEKVNTARRILESALKIECCFHDITVSYDYSKLRLGQLINHVKVFKDEMYKPIFNFMAEQLNKYSHDSGQPIDIEEAKTVCGLVMLYLELFRAEINYN